MIFNPCPSTTTAAGEHCFCLQDTIGRPLCCRCGAVGGLITSGDSQPFVERDDGDQRKKEKTG